MRIRAMVRAALFGLILSTAGLFGCVMQAGDARAMRAKFAAEEATVDGMPPALGDMAKAAAGGPAERLDPGLRKRLIVYNAIVEVRVDRIAYALEQVKTLAGSMGGYVREMGTHSVTIRVPAGKFHETVAAIEKLGRVRRKQVKGTDVTEQVRDWHIQLENAESVRQRLAKLLEKATKVEEILKVEKELARVTETVELLKAKLRQLEHSVAYSTITVQFTSDLPQDRLDTQIPFAWVSSLGADLVRGETGQPSEARSQWRRVALRLPKAYVRYYDYEYETRALSADGLSIRVRRLENYRGGSTEFWHGLIRRVLADEKHFTVGDEPTAKLPGGSTARILVASKEIGREKHGYLVAVATTKAHVYLFEAWGPLAKFTTDRPKFEAAVKSMQLGCWRQFFWHLF